MSTETSSANTTDPLSNLPLVKGTESITAHASTLAQKLTKWFDKQDWAPDSFVTPLALGTILLGLAILSWLTFMVARPLLLRIAQKAVSKSKVTWDNQLFGHGVFKWLTHLIPAIALVAIAPGLFASTPALAKVVGIASSLYLVVVAFFLLDSILNASGAIYQASSVAKKFQIGTFLQVIKLLAALVCIVLAIALLIGKSPAVLLSGLGVFASILMLVFKDVILGFVAGVQLASNQMLAVGDWLEMPSHKADGDVLEIGLTTVKVQNWDKTITTIPTHALISESFKNWRGMAESEGRRIKRSIFVDMNTIKLCDEEMLERFQNIEYIQGYLKKKKEEIQEHNSDRPADLSIVNGRRLTNIGTYRAYIESYLRNHSQIHQGLTLIVRQLQPDGRGLPIEIYCFSKNKVWSEYEGIQSDIFDHILAIAHEFDLKLFQNPSGSDLQLLKIQRA